MHESFIRHQCAENSSMPFTKHVQTLKSLIQAGSITYPSLSFLICYLVTTGFTSQAPCEVEMR